MANKIRINIFTSGEGGGDWKVPKFEIFLVVVVVLLLFSFNEFKIISISIFVLN